MCEQVNAAEHYFVSPERCKLALIKFDTDMDSEVKLCAVFSITDPLLAQLQKPPEPSFVHPGSSQSSFVISHKIRKNLDLPVRTSPAQT